MGWDDMEQARKEGKKTFITLKDGDSIEGVFRGEPRGFYQRFGDKVEYGKWDKGLSFRFRINFITKDEAGEYISKIMSGGATLRDQLLDAKEEYTLDCVFKIKRKGSGQNDTRYSILFKSKLTPKQLAAINKVELKTLHRDKEQITQYDEMNPPPVEEADIPF